jgi:nucleotide-binding universal stress UspA family protein
MSSAAPALGRVLCATDLSEFGNQAVPFAFAIGAPGGRVTLLTVLETRSVPSPLLPRYGDKHASPGELDARESAATAQLEALARAAAGTRGSAYEVRVARAAHVADAILTEAERIDAGAICLATHSRSGLAELILGSTAHEVLHRAGRPVVLIPAPVAG